MANHKSSIKRIRANEKKRVRNRFYARTMRNAIKKFRALEEKQVATEKYPSLVSMIDKLAKKNVIHKNKASNLKSNLALRVNALTK